MLKNFMNPKIRSYCTSSSILFLVIVSFPSFSISEGSFFSVRGG